MERNSLLELEPEPEPELEPDLEEHEPPKQKERRRSSLRYRSLSENDLINNSAALGNVLEKALLDEINADNEAEEEEGEEDDRIIMKPPAAIVIENDRTFAHETELADDFHVDYDDNDDNDNDDDDDDDNNNGEGGEAAFGDLPPPPPPPPFRHGTPVSISQLRHRNEEKLRQSLIKLDHYTDDCIDRTQKLREFLRQTWVREFVAENADRERIAVRGFHNGASEVTELKRFHTDDFYVNFPDAELPIALMHSSTAKGEVGFRKKSTIKDWVSRGSNDAHYSRGNGSDTRPIGPLRRRTRTRASVHREQLIESLAWFSFHTPRCVLEDLTNSELDQDEEFALLRPKHRSRRNVIDDGGSLSSLSDDASDEDGNQQLRRCSIASFSVLKLPYSVKRQSALVFVDISGFTKLSTMLDVESLSKVINSYFRMMVDEVVKYGGDILKFAGDAFFAEWRVATEDEIDAERERLTKNHPLTNLRASFLSHTVDMAPMLSLLEERSLAECVKAASLCASSMVALYSDFKVAAKSDQSVSFGVEQQGKFDAMLNVHCGVGVGTLVGLHVGDSSKNQIDLTQRRREFLFLGDPIDQVAKSADVATDGEVVASPEAITLLKETCDVTTKVADATEPERIALKSETFFFPRSDEKPYGCLSSSTRSESQSYMYDDLVQQCEDMDATSLARLHRQLSLYVHQVVRGEELDSSHRGETSRSKEDPYVILRDQAEIRLVYTMFIKAIMSPKITGDDTKDKWLYGRLQSIMKVTSRELRKYRGHLRQFIVDDKGVVLIGTFGLRGSTFANMVAQNALPATFAIHSALKSEVGVDTRIGATLGKVYCGVVGGIRRHEFAVMGAPVNLAARLMYSKNNKGILVDEAVQKNADSRFAFEDLPPVKAKGYDKPVNVFQPLHAVQPRKRGVAHGFIGRRQDVEEMTRVAKMVMEEDSKTMMAFIIGEAGMGKTALGMSISDEMKKYSQQKKKRFIFARSTSTETEQRIPLSSFRKIFLGAIRELCIYDGTLSVDDGRGSGMHPPGRGRLLRGTSRRGSFGRVRSRRLSIPKTYSRKVGSVRLTQADSSRSLTSLRSQNVPYLKKLCEICERIDYQYEYADIVGSQLLGLDTANPTTHVDGHIPTIDEIVNFLTKAYIEVTRFSDLTIIFLDDFQWIDSLTWKVVRLLCEEGQHIMLMGAMRSQETSALRRMSSVASWHGQMQSRIVEVNLQSLSMPEVKEMIARVLDCDERKIDDALCHDVYQRTGGLPIYLVELLESVKRNKTVEIDDSGKLKWTADAEKEHKRIGVNNMAAIELSFLNRFDSLDKTVRQVLQTCAVLGMSFALSDVVRVHMDTAEPVIEQALNAAVDELILMEDIEDDDDDEDESMWSGDDEPRTTSTWNAGDGDRFFQFSHTMWRKSVLDKMLKEQKINLHRTIAEAMENEQVRNKESSDIGRLLTLFDHWKSCGNFGKAAPLALAVGLRLEDWDLSPQSLDLYRDALEMCYESADNSDGREPVRDEKELWLPASAPPATVEFILRLHIRIAKCHAHLGEQEQCATTFEDAYKIMTTSPKAAKLNEDLVLPIISGLCSITIQRNPFQNGSTNQEELVERFVQEARERNDAIHICRALSMKASFYARLGSFKEAIEAQRELKRVYNVERHSSGIREEYGKDYAAQCVADAVQWFCLAEEFEMALNQTDFVVLSLVPHLDLSDVDAVMEIIFPVLMVMKTMGRCDEAQKLLFENAINPYHDLNISSAFAVKLFNPLAYLLYIINMEEEDNYDEPMLRDMEEWVLDPENSIFFNDWERKGYILIGEICWRLVRYKTSQGEGSVPLQEHGRRALMRVVHGPDDDKSDTYMRNSARLMLSNLDELEDDDDDDDDDMMYGNGMGMNGMDHNYGNGEYGYPGEPVHESPLHHAPRPREESPVHYKEDRLKAQQHPDDCTDPPSKVSTHCRCTIL